MFFSILILVICRSITNYPQIEQFQTTIISYVTEFLSVRNPRAAHLEDFGSAPLTGLQLSCQPGRQSSQT